MTKMAKFAILAKNGKIVTVASFAKMAKMTKMAKNAKIAKKDRIAVFFVECLSKGVISSICFATLSVKRFLLNFRKKLKM